MRLGFSARGQGYPHRSPDPRKSAIGIEVPNAEVAMVSLKEVLESKLNDRPDAKLMIGLGRNISGEAVLAELNKCPTFLLQERPEAGKRLCQRDHYKHLMRAKPHEVKMMMIDPKWSSSMSTTGFRICSLPS
ncbi:FtsK/SpoIIIE domain-containing protein [Bacillus licheniformis]|nr:FtsK/SpoIIIE domain-containing protein [Bacillus licheniformis]